MSLLIKTKEIWLEEGEEREWKRRAKMLLDERDAPRKLRSLRLESRVLVSTITIAATSSQK